MTQNVTTTAGEKFTADQSRDLCYMIWLRWGRDYEAAAAAYRRLMQNNCPDADFAAMVNDSPLGIEALNETTQTGVP